MNVITEIEKVWSVRSTNIEAESETIDGKKYVRVRVRNVGATDSHWSEFIMTASEWSYFLPAALETFNQASKE